MKVLLVSAVFWFSILALDFLFFYLLKTQKKKLWFTRRQAVCFHAFLHLLFFVTVFLRVYFNDDRYSNTVFSIWMLFSIAKFWILVFALGLKLSQIIDYVINKLLLTRATFLNESRRDFVKKSIILTSALPFVGVLHGITIGKHKYKIHKESLYYPDLPEAFDGFKIVQISDLHLGSFKDKEEVLYGFDLINQQEGDALLFTGDMVNFKYEETLDWIEAMYGLKAKVGKYSVLGNHDYGDYVRWSKPEDKQANLDGMCLAHEKMGFKLLRNNHIEIEKSGEKIFLAGSENWGKGRFQKYGDLDKTFESIPSNAFTILMSHDPSHFDKEVVPHSKHVHLTLSGHTHGMQFGVEVPGWIKWSPAKFQYPKWAGLYDEGGQKLYVNRGFGFIGFPGRVGIWPEITVLTLHKQKA